MPAYPHVNRARIAEVVAELEEKGERFIAAVPEESYDLVTVVSSPADPNRLTVNPDQLETRISRRLLGGAA